MMNNILVIFPLAVCFLISLLLIPSWIKKAKQIGLIWEDMNKFSKPKVAGSGGIIVVLSFMIGVLLFIQYNVFILNDKSNLIEILAMLVSISLLAGIGIIDDLLGWQKGGLRRRHRIVLVLVAAIPLMVINAGKSEVFLPLIGNTDLGLIYALAVIPIGILGSATTFNFLAGFNGLEAGQGILILTAISFVAYFTGNPWITIVALCMVCALLGFLIFNFYPAKVFPGDSLTYAVGGLIAILPILGNFERIAVFFFIPIIIEFFLKLRGGLVKQSFGKPMENNLLDLRYDKIYSLNHLAIFLMKKIKIKSTERRVVLFIWCFQTLIILVGLLLFRKSIF